MSESDRAQLDSNPRMTHVAASEQTEAPKNVDVPVITQTGNVLSCTMGNWENEPTSYSYQWDVGGNTVGNDAPNYAVSVEEVGETATCIVTATNAIGSTAAPPAPSVTIEGAS